MKFRITRTSDMIDDNLNPKPPIDEASSKLYTNKITGGTLLVWFVDVGSLKQLIGLIDRYGGAIVIEKRDYLKRILKDPFDTEYRIEIYDDYRE